MEPHASLLGIIFLFLIILLFIVAIKDTIGIAHHFHVKTVL